MNRILLLALVVAPLGATIGCEVQQPLAVVDLEAASDFDPDDTSVRHLYSGDSIRIRWRVASMSFKAVPDGTVRLLACGKPGTTVQSPPYSYGTNFLMSPVPPGFWAVYEAIEAQIGFSASIPSLPIVIPSDTTRGIKLERIYHNVNVSIAATRDRKVGSSWVAVTSTSMPVSYRTFGWGVDFPVCHDQGGGTS